MTYSLSLGKCSSILSGATVQGVDTLGGTLSCDMGDNYSNGSVSIPPKSTNAVYKTNIKIQYWSNGTNIQAPITAIYATSVNVSGNIVDYELTTAMKDVGTSTVFWSLLLFSAVVGMVISMAKSGVQAFYDMFDRGD